MDAATLDDAVRRADLDELLRLIDGLCAADDWDGLLAVRQRCARAHETGHQLWPAASHAAYRLALESPPEFAATTLDDEGAPFSLGPLPEVVAQSHEWHDLARHVPRGAPAVLAAHERVLRGEDLIGLELPGPSVLEVPLRLLEWEPRYALAEYRAEHADFPRPPIAAYEPVTLPRAPNTVDHDDAATALGELTRAWTTGSNGRAAAASVRGDVLDAIAAVDPTAARVALLDPAAAMAHMAWAAASGGAHGRRSGAAAGRFGAWWAAGAITGLLDDWPPDPAQLGDAIAALEVVVWDGAGADTGWHLHLALASRVLGRAWAVTATDTD